MYITWEDRKNYGTIDNNSLTTKPDLGFTYAWFLVNDHTAQYVESHDEGYFNENMSDEQKQAVLDFYNAWTPPVIEPYVPTVEEIREGVVVTMRQARLALLEQGLLATVDTAVANSDDEALKIEWEYAMDVKRNWTSLVALAHALGMTDEQLDGLFTLASTK